MLHYPFEAITTKNISQFKYSLYSAIGINMLKYNHDSSATIRLLSCLTDTCSEVAEDLGHQLRFNFKGYEFVNVDRLHGFMINLLEKFTEDNTGERQVVGYSRYTDKYYLMNIIRKRNDFIRHSIPTDAFFSGSVLVKDPVLVTAYPNTKTELSIDAEDTAITIRLISGFNLLSKEADDPIKLIVSGLDSYGDDLEEEIDVTTEVDIVTDAEFSKVLSVMVLNAKYSVEIQVFPYIKGETVMWDKSYIDRDTLDEYKTVLTVDRDAKQLVFNALRENPSEYPFRYEPVKTVDIDCDTIVSEFIDVNNRLLYIVDNDGANNYMKCYPLIIPKTHNNTLDNIKTADQLVRIEYYEDCIEEKFVFYIFPTSQTGDVDFMHIFVDGTLYQQDIMLDLVREKIETNRIEIPFSDLFNNKESVMLEFKTYGELQTVQPVLLDRTKLKTLWSKDLGSFMLTFKEEPAINAEGPTIRSSRIPYLPMGSYGYGEEGYGGAISGSEDTFTYGGFREPNISLLFKVSGIGNVTLDGARIINVFNSFYYDEDETMVITSDTITHIVAGVDILGALSDQAIITENNEYIGV